MGQSLFYRIDLNKHLISVDSVDQAIEETRDGEFFWLHYIEPESDDLQPLIHPLGLHTLSVEDTIDKNSVPKINVFTETTLVLINLFTYEMKQLRIMEIDLIIGKNFLISVDRLGQDGNPLLADIGEIAEAALAREKTGPAYLMHGILDAVVDRKMIALEAIEEELALAEDTLFERPGEFNPKAMQHIRRSLLLMRKSLYHEREVFTKIDRGDCPLIPLDAIFHFRDLYDHITRYFELSESLRDMETSLMEIDLSLRSNEMSRASNKTNRSVSRLTFISTIFLPLTLLASIGGMSEWSMMTGPENWRISYPLFLLATGIIGFATYRFLKRLANRDENKDDNS